MNNIQLNIVANAQFQQVYAEVAKLKEAMASLQKVSVGGPFAPGIASNIKASQTAFDNAIMSTRAFTIEHVAMTDSVTKFGKQLASGQLSLNNYYKIWRESAKGTSAELDALATSQARLNRSMAIADPLRPGYAKLVTDINGVVTAQEKAIFYQRALNTALHDGAMKMIDFGKNTQWMGRQLTVGLTMPLAMFGAATSAAYLSFDKQMTSMLKVYGSHAVVQSQQTLNQIEKQVTALADKLARTLGVTMADTVEIAKTFSSIGLEGKNLLAATDATAKLAKLGDLTATTAANSMVSLQNVFKLQASQVSDAVNFLNAAKHSTSTTMQDIVDALPRVGPIIQQMGGTYKDFTAFLVALKESGVPAAQGANAIKSMLASMINPTKAAQVALKSMHIDLQGIVASNQGNVMGMVQGLKQALDALPQSERLKAIEQTFGKFQFARVTALLDNLGTAGSQSAKVLELYGKSNAELAAVANQELRTASSGTPAAQFQKMKATLQADLIPMGRSFLQAFTKIGNIVDKILSAFKNISKVLGPVAGMIGKIFSGGLAGAIIIGPILMLTGLFANLIGNLLKGANYFRMFRQGMEQAAPATNRFMAGIANMRNFYENLDKGIIASRNQMDLMPEAITSNAKAFDILTASIRTLTAEFQALFVAQEAAGMGGLASYFGPAAPAATKFLPIVARNKGGLLPGYNTGGTVGAAKVPGPDHITYDSVIGDVPVGGFVLNKQASKSLLRGYNSGGTISAMLTPGELVFDPQTTKNNRGALEALNNRYAVGGHIRRNKSAYGIPNTAMLAMEEMRALAQSQSGRNMLQGIADSKSMLGSSLENILAGYKKPDYSQMGRTSKNSFWNTHPLLSESIQKSNQVVGHLYTDNYMSKYGHFIDETSRSSAPRVTMDQLNQLGLQTNSNANLFDILPNNLMVIDETFNKKIAAGTATLNDWTISNPEAKNLISLTDFLIQKGVKEEAIKEVRQRALNEINYRMALIDGNINELSFGNMVTESSVNALRSVDPRLASSFNESTGLIGGVRKSASRSTRKLREISSFAMGGMINPAKRGYGIPGIEGAVLEELTANWYKQKGYKNNYWTKQWEGNVAQTDPLHGPLNIGRSSTVKVSGKNPYSTDAEKYGHNNLIQYNGASSSYAFPVGTAKERAKQALYQYMSGYGNTAAMSDITVQKGLKELSTQFTGNAYRGINFTTSSLSHGGIPSWLSQAIYEAQSTGDFSKIMGKSFMMRSSSWSKDKAVADYFVRGKQFNLKTIKPVVFEVPLNNRTVVDASSIFPGMTHPFEDPITGQNTYKSEQEMLFGGAFKITHAEPGKIVLSTAPGAIPGREKGGPVNSGKPYIVGEKGPELFVPNNSGNIIPRFNGGGYNSRGNKVSVIPDSGVRLNAYTTPTIQEAPAGMNLNQNLFRESIQQAEVGLSMYGQQFRAASSKLGEGLLNAGSRISETVTGTISDVTTTVSESINNMKAVISEAAVGLKTSISGTANSIRTSISETTGNIRTSISENASAMKTKGGWGNFWRNGSFTNFTKMPPEKMMARQMQGMGVMMGAQMLGSMLPQNAATGAANQALSMGSMAYMMGASGPAAAAVGGVVLAVKAASWEIGHLIKLHKEHLAVVQATYSASTTAINMFNNSIKKTYQALTVTIGQLKSDDPLKKVADFIKGMDSKESIIGTLNTFIAEQVVSGADPKEIEKMVKAILTYTNQTNLLGEALKEIKKDNADVSVSTETYIKKLFQGTSAQDGWANNLKDMSEQGQRASKGFYSLFNILKSGNIPAKNLHQVILGISKSTGDAESQMSMLKLAAKDAGDTQMTGLISSLEDLKLNAGEVKASLGALEGMSGLGVDTSVILGNFAGDGKGLKDFLSGTGKMNGQDITAYGKSLYESTQKASQSAINAQNAVSNAGANATKGLQSQLDKLTAQKKILDDQIKLEQKKAETIKLQNDYLNKQSDLNQQIKQAEITGNYLQAAQLRTVQQQNTAQYRSDQSVAAKQTQADAIQSQMDALSQKINTVGNAAQNAANNSYALKSSSPILSMSESDFVAKLKASASTDFSKITDANPLPVKVTNDTSAHVATAAEAKANKAIEDATGSVTSNTQTITGEEVKKAWVSAGNKEKDWKGINRLFGQKILVNGHMMVLTGGQDANGHFIIIPPKTKAATGGFVKGPGTWTSDSIPAMLSNGEYVVKASAVAQYGAGMLDAINNKRYNVPTTSSPAVSGGASSVSQEITFNISGVSDPHAVANMVMQKLKVANAKTNKGNGVNI